MSSRLDTIINSIRDEINLNGDDIVRKNLGDAAFNEIEPILTELIEKLEILESTSQLVSNSTNNQVYGALVTIYNAISSIPKLNDTDFITRKPKLIISIKNGLDGLRQFWSQYYIVHLEESHPEKINTNSANQLLQTTEEALKQIREQAARIINQAESRANDIEKNARKTATKISVKEAQEQFQEAADHNIKQIRLWMIITFINVIAFISFVFLLLSSDSIPDEWDWSAIYKSILRIGLIGLLSTLLAFSLKMLKANLHMHQHNMHRKRIANSMASFAESAINNNQRDQILSQLVQSVSNFGNSGIIQSDSKDTGISIDSISKTVSSFKD